MKLPSIQLALKYSDAKCVYPRIAEPKLDGVRVVIIPALGAAYNARNWKQRFDLQTIIDALADRKEWVFDGELYGGDWNRTMQKDTEKAFFVFDAIPWELFQAGRLYDSTQEQRSALLRTILPDSDLIQAIPSIVVDSKEEAAEAATEFVRRGFEGAILKNPNGFYTYRRDENWLKIKPEFEEDAVIVGAEEGKGRCEGSLGALVVMWANGTTTNVGGGKQGDFSMTDAQRREFWQQYKAGTLVGTVVEVSFERPVGGKIPYRYPRVKRIRTDKDANSVVPNFGD